MTGRKVILNLRFGGAGADWRGVGGGIGGGSCTGRRGKNEKFGFFEFEGADDRGGLDGDVVVVNAGTVTGGSILSSGGSKCGRIVGRLSGEAVGVGVCGWGSGVGGDGSGSVGDWGRRGRRRIGTASR